MFTGITEHVGKIESLEHTKDGGRLRVSLEGAGALAAEMKLGDSIAVNGCCLTVVEFDKNHFSADLSGETLRRTSFGEKKSGHLVNLERPLAANARLGGHFVQGHVDGIVGIHGADVGVRVSEGNDGDVGDAFVPARDGEADAVD